jgi:hypothetical protein
VNSQPLDGKPTTVALAFTEIECWTRVSRGHEETAAAYIATVAASIATVAAYIAAKGKKRMAFRVFDEGFAAELMPMLVVGGCAYLLKAVYEAAAQPFPQLSPPAFLARALEARMVMGMPTT